MQAFLAGAGFPLAGVRKHAAEGLDAQVLEQAVQGQCLGGLPLGQRILHPARGGLVKLDRHPAGNKEMVRIGFHGKGFRRRYGFFRATGGHKGGQRNQGYQVRNEAFHAFRVFLVSKYSLNFLKM